MDFSNWTAVNWINVAVFALTSLAGAGWFMEMFSSDVAVKVAGGMLYVSSILNFMLDNGKPSA